MEKICIVIPAYNEERRIGKTLEAYSNYFENLRKNKYLDYEILVVINNTKDRTEEIVKQFIKENERILYLNLKPGGKGFAVIEGFKDALKRNNDLIGFVDADMATSPEEYWKLVKSIRNHDGVIASRWQKNSLVKNSSFIRRINSSGFNFIVRSLFLFKYKDTQCGAKLFKRKVIENIHNKLGITQWAFDIDLLYKIKLKDFKIIEIPTTWENKEDATLNILKAPLQMFASVLRLRLIYSPFNFVIRSYDLLPEKIKMHNLK